ncbi:MAG TPA: response regulator, partial [Novosphingobium sp.]|nr:response regulator [Novosphingobium sp.]
MHEAKVLVVDDSAAMRALFSDVLEQSRNVRVIGTAANAAEAREQIAALKPNVLTLDVEMPGMSGIEFLEEIMSSQPMPVVMLSSLTQAGTETSLKAYDLGAVECFPKPLKATPEQFAKTVGKLGKIVLAAANSNVRERTGHHHRAAASGNFEWNGHVAAISASMPAWSMGHQSIA